MTSQVQSITARPAWEENNQQSPANLTDATLRDKIEFRSSWIVELEQRASIQQKKNLIIKGLKISENHIPEQINEFAGEIVDLTNPFKQVDIIKNREGRSIFCAQVKTQEARRVLLAQNRKSLAKKGIYINPDLSHEERKIAFEVRECARKARSEGKTAVSVGLKLVVDNIWYTWSLADDKLVPLPQREKRDGSTETREREHRVLDNTSGSKNEMATELHDLG